MSGMRRRVGAGGASKSIGDCKRRCNLGDVSIHSLEM